MKTLQPLIRTLGSEPLLKATEDRYLSHLVDGEEHPSVGAFITHIAATDMHLLEQIATSPLVTDNPNLVVQLLGQAYHLARSPKARGFVKSLAARVGLAKALPLDGRPPELLTLTASQTQALDQLLAQAQLFFEQSAHPGPVRLRLTPLVLGPSGVGKSFLVAQLGRLLGLPAMRISLGDWIVNGAKQEPTTIQSIQRRLDESPAGLIIHIDELDKFSSREAWGLAQQAELFSLLDRDVGFAGTDRHPWTAYHARMLREKVLLVGSGTWQLAWSRQIGRTLGFSSLVPGAEDIAAAVRKENLIPEELLNRFGRWHPLAPYTEEDFARISRALALPAGRIDAGKAVQSGLNFRYIENALTEHALMARIARNTASRGTTESTFRPASAPAL